MLLIFVFREEVVADNAQKDSRHIKKTQRKTRESAGIKDTMDIALCSINRETRLMAHTW